MTEDRRPPGLWLGVAITLTLVAIFSMGFYCGTKYAARKALHTQILLPWELEPWDQVQLSTALLVNAVKGGGCEIQIKDQYTAKDLLDEELDDITYPAELEETGPTPTRGDTNGE